MYMLNVDTDIADLINKVFKLIRKMCKISWLIYKNNILFL